MGLMLAASPHEEQDRQSYPAGAAATSVRTVFRRLNRPRRQGESVPPRLLNHPSDPRRRRLASRRQRCIDSPSPEHVL
jgi:predicted Zn-dependent protease